MGILQAKKIKENRNFGYILVTSAYNILPAKGKPLLLGAQPVRCYKKMKLKDNCT